MANILGLKGMNRSSSATNVLLAAYGNDVVNVATGLGYGLGLTGNNVEMEAFLDRIFLQDYNTRPITFNGTAWSTEYVPRTMIGKYLKNYKEKSRMYIANCKFPGPQAPVDLASAPITFPSRVFHSDPFFGNNLTWGIEWGTNGVTVAGSPYFNLAQPLAQDFVATNIKVGDPLFITSGDAQLASKPYFVQSVVSPYRLQMTENFPVSASSLNYWVGSNWFDVATDDNDQLMGLGENVTRMLLFKLMSIWYYTGSLLKQIKDAPGTSSSRSIISKGGFTYYFHGSDPYISGIYRTDSTGSVKVSRGLDPYILGMSVSNYSSVVGWEEGESLRWYIGDLTNTNYGISMSNAVISLHLPTGAWDVSPIADVIKAATTWRVSNQKDTYLGTNDDQVLKMASGNSHNGTPITLNVETKIYYPSGTEKIDQFKHLQIIGRQTRGLKVKLKLWDNPTGVGEWVNLGECTNDKTEFLIPGDNSIASGFQLGFFENGSLENDLFVEKATMFYNPEMVRIIQP